MTPQPDDHLTIWIAYGMTDTDVSWPLSQPGICHSVSVIAHFCTSKITKDNFSLEVGGFMENTYLWAWHCRRSSMLLQVMKVLLILPWKWLRPHKYVVKVLEDIMVCYDRTVRNPLIDLLQFVYDKDGIDGAFIEWWDIDSSAWTTRSLNRITESTSCTRFADFYWACFKQARMTILWDFRSSWMWNSTHLLKIINSYRSLSSLTQILVTFTTFQWICSESSRMHFRSSTLTSRNWATLNLCISLFLLKNSLSALSSCKMTVSVLKPRITRHWTSECIYMLICVMSCLWEVGDQIQNTQVLIDWILKYKLVLTLNSL